MIYALVRTAGEDPEWTEDTVCEIAYRILKSLRSFRAESSFGTWLRRVARNVCVDELRKLQRQRKREWFGEYSTEDDEDPAELAAERELHDKALVGLSQLPDKAREAIALRFLAGESHKDIAQFLGVALDTVKSRISYGLRKLRKMLGEADSGTD